LTIKHIRRICTSSAAQSCPSPPSGELDCVETLLSADQRRSSPARRPDKGINEESGLWLLAWNGAPEDQGRGSGLAIIVVSDQHVGYQNSDKPSFNTFLKGRAAEDGITDLVFFGDVVDMWRRDAPPRLPRPAAEGLPVSVRVPAKAHAHGEGQDAEISARLGVRSDARAAPDGGADAA
jgi:hypothetical protein